MNRHFDSDIRTGHNINIESFKKYMTSRPLEDRGEKSVFLNMNIMQ